MTKPRVAEGVPISGSNGLMFEGPARYGQNLPDRCVEATPVYVDLFSALDLRRGRAAKRSSPAGLR